MSMRNTYFSNVRSDNRNLSKDVDGHVEPLGQVFSAVLSKILSSHCPELDAERL